MVISGRLQLHLQFKLPVFSFYQDSSKIWRMQTLPCSWKIFKHLFDLGHRFKLDVFLKCAPHTVVHGIYNWGSRRPEIGAGEGEILRQPFLTLFQSTIRSRPNSVFTHMLFQQQPSPSTVDHCVQQFHISVWIQPKTLFKDMGRHYVTLSWDTPKGHHDLVDHGLVVSVAAVHVTS